MNPKDLTYQAFKLYNAIRASCYKAAIPSENWIRLYTLQTKVFYRYLRRLKSEIQYDNAYPAM